MRSVVLLLALASLPAASCKDDDDLTPELGARCQDSAECSSLCLPPSETTPGGLCTHVCETDDDCGGSAVCATVQAMNVCLFACRDDRDCNFLGSSTEGSAWSCHDMEGVLVCLGD